MSVLFERNANTSVPRSPPRMNIKMEKPVTSSVVISGKSNYRTNIDKIDNTSTPPSICSGDKKQYSNMEKTRQKYNYSLKCIAEDFQKQITFNETDLNDIGIDLDATFSYMPYLRSVVRKECMGSKTKIHIPSGYPTTKPEKLEPFLSNASNEALLFIFYTKIDQHLKGKSQPAQELEKRGFKYQNGKWILNGKSFNLEKWSFEPDN